MSHEKSIAFEHGVNNLFPPLYFIKPVFVDSIVFVIGELHTIYRQQPCIMFSLSLIRKVPQAAGLQNRRVIPIVVFIYQSRSRVDNQTGKVRVTKH